MAKCVFCEKKMVPGTGTLLIKNDAKLLHFCSSKCERNMLKLKRKASNLRWARPEK